MAAEGAWENSDEAAAKPEGAAENSEAPFPGAGPRPNADVTRPCHIRVGVRTQAAAKFFPPAACQDPACPKRAQGQRCQTRNRVGGVLGGEASCLRGKGEGGKRKEGEERSQNREASEASL